MKRRITYLNCVLTIIAVALTVIILQNAHIIQPVQASHYDDVVEVDIVSINGFEIPMGNELPVIVRNFDEMPNY